VIKSAHGPVIGGNVTGCLVARRVLRDYVFCDACDQSRLISELGKQIEIRFNAYIAPRS